MLIRFLTENDLLAWYALATEVSPLCRMTVNFLCEKRGGSFHYRYPEFINASYKEKCPACNDEPTSDGKKVIEINDKVWIFGCMNRSRNYLVQLLQRTWKKQMSGCKVYPVQLSMSMEQII